MIVLSHFQAQELLDARKSARDTILISTDLGLTRTEARIEAPGVKFPSGERLTWEETEEIAANQNNCFLLAADGLRKVIEYSELTDRAYSLYPTAGAPTMLISGIPMHRIKDTTPDRDTREKLRAMQPLYGWVLDTATGLGYTAIAAAKTAQRVTTIELDPAVIRLARLNPWSRGLFTDPKIEPIIGDSSELVCAFPDGCFSAILHDPPMRSLAGELYGREFYAELSRVLRAGGRLFHYIGDPDSRYGASTGRGVAERLKSAGFIQVERRPQAFGVVAYKVEKGTDTRVPR
jgi:predicted methyltransferase